MRWTPGMWRVGLVFLLYGIFYLATREIAPIWIGMYLVPLYFLVEPKSEEMAKNHARNRQNGFLPYAVTMTGLGLGLAAGLIYIYSYLYNLAFGPTLLDILHSGLAALPIFLTVFVSWRIRERAYKHYEAIWKREEKAARKRARKRKKKKQS